MNGRLEDELAAVSEETKQARDIRARWSWVEPEVWTDRMLTALEQGVQGGKWFSLMDKVYRVGNLRQAYYGVQAKAGAAGVDHETVEMFARYEEANLEKLSRLLSRDEYQPAAVKRVWIPKPGSKEKRPLGIPTVRDRVVQAALCHVLEPIFERDFAEHSYGFRPKRGCKDALRRVEHLLHHGCTWVVDADLKSYFDTIPVDRLLALVADKVSDGRVLNLVQAYLRQGVLEEGKHWTPEQGTPQGGVISPLLSNIYLDPLDHHMEALKVEMVRYADDFVLLCRTESQAQAALAEVQRWTAAAGLTLHPEKTRIVDATQRGGFDFLGYHFERGMKWPRAKSLGKLKTTVRSFTRRSNGNSLPRIIAQLNRSLTGWFQYFQHSHKTTFPSVDGWIRMRLRSILRRRQGKRGRGRAYDHQRWTNDFFAGQGLFSMCAAHTTVRQSLRRANH
ncbi:MAG TPA: group II intron reverse transcriptase/maturase [Acidobacteriaceae bacterium]|jgi:RNA-directed DNA polymerase